ncbi:MAG TPA: hypothetical protein VMU57_10490, partial [Edaphobacter sp.]
AEQTPFSKAAAEDLPNHKQLAGCGRRSSGLIHEGVHSPSHFRIQIELLDLAYANRDQFCADVAKKKAELPHASNR